jgi:uncharacterized membrane protein YdjX (TVP38/TMEM64 family)
MSVTRAPEQPTPRTAWRRIVAAGAGVVGVIVLVGRIHPYLLWFALWIERLGVWGPIVFVAGYAIGTIAFIPGALLTLAGGAVFGVPQGTAYVFLGETLGGAVAFLLSRRIARRTFERRLAQSPRFLAVDRAISGEGLKIVFLLRLAPIFPFCFLNYALGLTEIRFRDYLVASIGMLPGTVAYVYYGKLAGDVAALADGVPATAGPLAYTLSALGLVATVLATVLVARVARNALRRAAEV